MSNANNEDFIRTTLSIGLAFSNILQRGQEQAREQERKIAIRKAQVRAHAIRENLISRKNALATRLVMVIGKLSNPNEKERAKALYDQVFNADLSIIPEYERVVDSTYPESIVRPTMQIIQMPMPSTQNLLNPTTQRLPLYTMFDSLNLQPFRITPPPQAPEVKEDEKKINISKFSELERLADDIKSGSLTCAICLEKFGKDDKDVEIRRCLHAFHKKCLSPWENSGRTNGKTCPCCRQ
jgi:hypothetical protein